jgi:hypothetical protein
MKHKKRPVYIAWEPRLKHKLWTKILEITRWLSIELDSFARNNNHKSNPKQFIGYGQVQGECKTKSSAS